MRPIWRDLAPLHVLRLRSGKKLLQHPTRIFLEIELLLIVGLAWNLMSRSLPLFITCGKARHHLAREEQECVQKRQQGQTRARHNRALR